MTKIDPTIMSNLHAHPHTMRKTHAKFQNNGCKTVRGVALTRYPCCVDGWTDGRTNGRTYERTNVRTDERTNGRKLARLCLPAKAGATIKTDDTKLIAHNHFTREQKKIKAERKPHQRKKCHQEQTVAR